MKTRVKVSIVLLAVIFASTYVSASGTVGIFAVVSKVVFEPNDKSPERIQIWGAFSLVDGGSGSDGPTLKPRRGYLYFSLSGAEDATQKDIVLKEWRDFKSIAGTGQAVAFGRLFYVGTFSDELMSPTASRTSQIMMLSPGGYPARQDNPVRAESMVPTSPNYYPLNMGLTKLSATGNLSVIVKKLQDALVR